MTFGTADRRKADVAEGVALTVGHVATRRGNRLGGLAFGEAEPRIRKPRQGRLGLLGLLSELRREPAAEGAGATSIGDAATFLAASRGRAGWWSWSATSAARWTGRGRCARWPGATG